MKKGKITLILLLMLMLASCSNNTSKKVITIAAASSLENVFEEELIKLYEKNNRDIKIKGIYDSSGKLATQIEEGLSIDLFISASSKQMSQLENNNLVKQENIHDLLENVLVLISSKDTKLNINSFSDITKANQIAIANPESVPAGIYAKQLLTHLNLWDNVINKASLGSNVTEVLNWVSQGSAQVGIVYESDARSDSNVKIIATDTSNINKIVYPIGIVNDSPNKDESKKFIDFLKSKDAKEIFIKYGFKPIN